MPPLKNIVGNKYNSLTVLEQAENINGRVAWKCKCDCGRDAVIRTGDLTTEHVKTCGNCDNVYDSVRYEFKDGYVIGYAKNGREFLIDEEDLFKIKSHSVTVESNGYVKISINGEYVPLHRFLMKPEKDKVVDHINRIPSDNRRNNLRICTQSENKRNNSLYKNNKTGFTGVHYIKKSNKYGAQIRKNNETFNLGEHDNLDDAINARVKAEIEIFGEFSPVLSKNIGIIEELKAKIEKESWTNFISVK